MEKSIGNLDKGIGRHKYSAPKQFKQHDQQGSCPMEQIF